jgi:hypothetical protein
MERRGLKVMGFQEDNINVLQKVFDEEWEALKKEYERRYVRRALRDRVRHDATRGHCDGRIARALQCDCHRAAVLRCLVLTARSLFVTRVGGYPALKLPHLCPIAATRPSRLAETMQSRKQEEEEIKKRRFMERQRAEEVEAVQADPRVTGWMNLVRASLC